MKIVIDEVSVQTKKDRQARKKKAAEILSSIADLMRAPVAERRVETSDICIEVTPEEHALLREFGHSDHNRISVPSSLVYLTEYGSDGEEIFSVEYRIREHDPIVPFEGSFEGQETCQRHD